MKQEGFTAYDAHQCPKCGAIVYLKGKASARCRELRFWSTSSCEGVVDSLKDAVTVVKLARPHHSSGRCRGEALVDADGEMRCQCGMPLDFMNALRREAEREDVRYPFVRWYEDELLAKIPLLGPVLCAHAVAAAEAKAKARRLLDRAKPRHRAPPGERLKRALDRARDIRTDEQGPAS